MKNLINNQKNIFKLSVLLMILVGYLEYSYQVKSTLVTYKMYTQLNDNIQLISKIPNQIQKSKILLEKLQKDGLLVDSVNISQRNRLLSFAESNAGIFEIEIIELASPLSIEKNDYKLQYNKLIIKGSYKNLLMFYYKYEQNKVNDRMISLRFFSKHNNKKNCTELFSEALIISIIKTLDV